ncbi:MAG: tetratricopeptide repeat protein [Chitinophagaceae bacterium]|nr:MAG: tetratricopeptide repeat protein [Chitinophagaceae bacterium]
MKKLWLPFAFLACSLAAGACINGETRELKDGTLLFADRGEETRVPHGHEFVDINFGRTMASLEAGWRRTGNAEYRSDMGVLLILQKKYNEARDLYLELERKKPGRYSTASNLGTVYELLGKNDSALYWIQRAVAINPRSHEGSEWIHVNILKAKVAGIADPTAQALLDTDFGPGPKPHSTRNRSQLWELDKALFYQLNERMSFIKPVDPVIARLLFELGNIRWLESDLYSVEALYAEARRYGFNDPLLQERLTRLKAEQRAKASGDTSAAAIRKELDRDTAVRATAAISRDSETPQGSKRREGLFWAVGIGFVLLAAFVGFLFFRRSR